MIQIQKTGADRDILPSPVFLLIIKGTYLFKRFNKSLE